MSNKVILMILDGWGIGSGNDSDAISKAKTPFVSELYTKYPNCQLLTHGENVGLPDGQMGNSEVGHLNIGAGRVVYQDLVKINRAIKDGSFKKNEALVTVLKNAKKNNQKVHFMGLVSNGGVHSSEEHLYELCDMAKDFGIDKAFVHVFTDGRDTDPKSGLKSIAQLQKKISNTPVKIASVIGRYYAMDRDKRWERVKEAYDLLVHGKGTSTTNILQSVEASYEEGITDEFIKPLISVDTNGNRLATIEEGDAVICFNFRTDRCREITTVLTQEDFGDLGMAKLKLDYLTMTNYDKTFKSVTVAFDKDNLQKTLGEIISTAGKNQIRIAETEKYPHVTFFFSGGREENFENEKRLLINSPKVATYDLQPEMGANEITEAIVKEIETGTPDFVCLNFANPDMVGHTGVFSAIVKAVETVDSCTQKVVEAGIKNNYSFIIIADHGNADYAINDNGTPNTAHTTNPVPCFLINNEFKNIENGKLADVAPTILKMMHLEIPAEMTGNVLVS